MFWRPKNLYEYARPTLLLWKFTGLPTLKTDTTTNKVIVLQTSVLCCVATFLLTSKFIVFLMFYAFENTLKSMMTVNELVSIFTQNVGFVGTAYLRKGKIAVLFTQIFGTETRIRQFCWNKFNYEDISQHLTLVVAVKTILVLVIIVLDFSFMITEPKEYAFRYCFYGGFIYYFVSDLTILFFLASVEKLYSEFEKQLQQQQVVSLSELNEIVESHKLLRRLAQSVSNEMQYFLLPKFLNDFFLIASDVFYGATTTIHLSYSLGSALAMTTALSLWMVLIFHSIITITYLFDKISEQVTKLLKNYNYNLGLKQ